MKKNSLYVLFILMTGMVFLAGGISYALISYQGMGEKEISISTNGIAFKYKEGSRKIQLNDAMPMTDSEGKAQLNYFEFDLSGYTDQNYEIPYDITLRKSKNSADIDNAVKLYLTSVDKNGNETEIILTNYANINKYINENIDLSNHTEKLLYSSKVSSNTSFSQKFRLRMWISYDVDFTQEKYNNAKYDLTVNVYGKGKVKSSDNEEESKVLVPGLYDHDNNLLASWDSLVNDYGLDIEKNYSPGTDFNVDASTGISYIFKTNSILGAILLNNPSLANGTHLVIGNDVTKIGEAALLTNPGFSIIDCPSSVTEIGSMAFSGASVVNYSGSAVDSENFNWGATTLNPYIEGDFAYSDNTKTNIVAYIGSSESVIIPSGVTIINSGAFEYKTNLKSVTIPASVTKIGEVAFAYTGIETVVLEENSSLSTVEENAFYQTPWFTTEKAKGKVYLNGKEVK